MICKQSGFSLIEVLLSFLLIGIGSLGLIKLQVYMERKADFAERSIEALNLAEQKLEWFRTRGISNAMSSISGADFSTDFSAGSSAVASGYTVYWNVPSSSVSGALKTIEIKTTWTDRLGDSHSIELKTMISKYSEFDM